MVLNAIGTCAYAGLAILGWGGFRPFFSHPALIALVVVTIALSVVSFFAVNACTPHGRLEKEESNITKRTEAEFRDPFFLSLIFDSDLNAFSRTPRIFEKLAHYNQA